MFYLFRSCLIRHCYSNKLVLEPLLFGLLCFALIMVSMKYDLSLLDHNTKFFSMAC